MMPDHLDKLIASGAVSITRELSTNAVRIKVCAHSSTPPQQGESIMNDLANPPARGSALRRDEELFSEANELFNVVQFLVDGSHEVVRREVTPKEAVHAAYHYTHNVASNAGITQRVIITDGGDSVVFEWVYGKGVVWPITVTVEKDYRK
jgi:hypothetical protein